MLPTPEEGKTVAQPEEGKKNVLLVMRTPPLTPHFPFFYATGWAFGASTNIFINQLTLDR